MKKFILLLFLWVELVSANAHLLNVELENGRGILDSNSRHFITEIYPDSTFAKVNSTKFKKVEINKPKYVKVGVKQNYKKVPLKKFE